MIIKPEDFVNHFFATESKIIITGLIFEVFFIPLLFSFIYILPGKVALVITDNYLIDRSRYESLGKIYWSEIAKIRVVKKTYLRITFKKPIFKERKIFFLKQILLFMLNWKYKDSIIITTGFLECDIDYLKNEILSAYRNYKRKTKIAEA